MTNSKMKTCKSCETEVAKSAKNCPKCGAKLKWGKLPKLAIGVLGLVVLGALMMPSQEERAAQQDAALASVAKAQPSPLRPDGELAAIFNLMSQHTDLQRDNKEKEITGQVVQWTLPVYEVKQKEPGIYRVQTSSTGGTVGTFVTLHTRGSDEVKRVEGLKTGDMISVKGRIDGVSMRHLQIEDAVLSD